MMTMMVDNLLPDPLNAVLPDLLDGCRKGYAISCPSNTRTASAMSMKTLAK